MWEKFIRGLPIGIANTLPGISGGTIALILGIYDDLITAVKRFDLPYLLPTAIGIGIGIFSTSFATSYLLAHFPNEVLSFLIGLIVISTMLLVRKEKIHTKDSFIWMFLGILISYIFSNVEMGVTWKSLQFPLYFLGGFIATGAMILPGVSGATALILLGIYEDVLSSVTILDFKILLPFGIGVIFGFFIFAGLMSFLLTKQRTRSMGLIVGLIVGSLPTLWPKWSIIGGLLAFLGGVAAYFLRERAK